MELLSMKYIRTCFLLLFLTLFLMIVGMGCKPKDPPLKEYSEFYQAILDGEYKTVQQLLKKYPSLISWEFNFAGYQGDSLITATLANSLEIVELLLKSGAEPNYYANDGVTALMVAVEQDRIDIAKKLIHEGADIYLQDKKGNTALHFLAQNGSLELVAPFFLKVKNIDLPNHDGISPLAIALANYHNELAFRFIEAGADLEKALDSAPHIIPEFVMNDNREMLEYFWKKNLIDPYVMYEHNNLFHYACWQNNINFVKELLARGLWDSTPNPAGDTPLDLAREFGNQEIIDLVTASGFKD